MNFTEDQIQEMKRQHGDIFLVEVEDKSCILHQPTRKDLSYVSATKDPIKMQELLMKQLWVNGDKEILERDDLFLAVASQMDEIIKTKEAKVKKALEDAEVELGDGDNVGMCILYLNTFLMRNMCIEPDRLSDGEWAFTIRYLTDILKLESKGNE